MDEAFALVHLGGLSWFEVEAMSVGEKAGFLERLNRFLRAERKERETVAGALSQLVAPTVRRRRGGFGP